MMKESYLTPAMEIVEFDTEDVITTSGESSELKNGGSAGVPESISFSALFG